MFVTALSWAFIGLGALAMLFCLLLSLMMTAAQRSMEHGTTPFGAPYAHLAQAMERLPPPWPWVYAHEGQLLLIGAAWAALHLICAIGLLWRKPWARRSFIVLMAMDIVLQGFAMASAIYMQPALQQAMQSNFPAQLPPAFMAWMQRVMAFQQIEAIIRPVLLAVVFSLIAWQLSRASIREEFSTVRL